MKYKLSILSILLLFVALVLVPSVPSYADFSKGSKVVSGELLLSNQVIEFEHSPFEINGELMVPAKSYLEKLGTQVLTTDIKGEIITYRDNIFIKFLANTDIAYVNGKEKKMPVHAMMHHNELYVSASFVASAYEMTYQADPTLHTLSINYKENDTQYREIANSHYKRVSDPNLGIHYYIPEYWDALGESNDVFGIDSFFENSRLEVTSKHLLESESRSEERRVG